jgi:hypothetical protein
MRPINRLPAAIAILLLISCGKKGDPSPPVPVIPRAATDLVVTQRGSKMILSWSYPSLTTAGQTLKEISRISVYRYVETLPPPLAAQEPRLIDPSQPRPSEAPETVLFSKVSPLIPDQFAKLKSRIDTIDARRVPAYTVGARVMYQDEPPLRTPDGRAERVTYAVTTDAPGGKGALSNLATIVPLNVATAPTGVATAARPEGVALTWNVPAGGLLRGSAPTVVGYNIYRLAPSGDNVDIGQPVNTSPAKEPHYLDVPPFGSWRYEVTAVASTGPPLVQSDASEKAAAQYVDLIAPPLPTNVTTLVEEKAVRLLWEGVEAPDLAGYKVYRTVQGGSRTLLTQKPIRETNYRDISAPLGATYTYSVSSIDQKGNESEPRPSTAVLLPR